MEREHLKSRLGFILLSAGCAIGIGNVWKFPYMAGQYGGGMFVLIYLFFLVVMGMPVLIMEFSLGRASRKSPVKLYDALEPAGTKWHLHGYAAMAGNYLLMMFYTVVAGWMLKYFFSTATGTFEGMTSSGGGVNQEFANMTADAGGMVLFTFIIIIAGFFICSFSLQKGVERITKYMMLALLAIMLVLSINSFTLEGAGEGLSFYLKPDFEKMVEIGVGNVIVGAMTQAFFTLSLGIGAMAIFGSYIGKERSLMGESVNVLLLDTFVAIVAGLIIFPACATYGVDVDSGPNLIFVTLPHIFNNMPLGRVWGSFFFLFMTFAAMSTVLAVFENIISCCRDLTGWSRRKTCIVNCLLMLVLSLPCVFGFNLLSGLHPLGGGTNIMDLEDFLVSNILLPLGSLIYVLFCTCKKGWGWKNFLEEANTGKGMKFPAAVRVYVSYILPVMIAGLFVYGIVTYFI